jgi:hypothetical protein
VLGQVSNDVSEFTCANFLQPGEKTPVAARLSTVTHEKGYVLFWVMLSLWWASWRLNKYMQNKLNSMSNAYLLPELTPVSAAYHVCRLRDQALCHLGNVVGSWALLAIQWVVLLVRSQVVLHCRSPESLRDVRGFSVKFYTKEGNFDMVRRWLYCAVLLALPMRHHCRCAFTA